MGMARRNSLFLQPRREETPHLSFSAYAATPIIRYAGYPVTGFQISNF